MRKKAFERSWLVSDAGSNWRWTQAEDDDILISSRLVTEILCDFCCLHRAWQVLAMLWRNSILVKIIEVRDLVEVEQTLEGEWSFLRNLPQVMLGFSLDATKRELGSRTQFFSYRDVEKHLEFCAMYDKNTKEYNVRRKMGLTEFCDVDFCAADVPGFERLLKARMQESLNRMSFFDENAIDSIVKKKGILEWGRELQLSQRCLGFVLFISPAEPLKVINGSYIVLDYSDFATESNLVIYYNMFRDDFFAEIRINRLPEMTTLFDAGNTKELGVVLSKNLEKALTYMKEKIAADKL